VINLLNIHSLIKCSCPGKYIHEKKQKNKKSDLKALYACAYGGVAEYTMNHPYCYYSS